MTRCRSRVWPENGSSSAGRCDYRRSSASCATMARGMPGTLVVVPRAPRRRGDPRRRHARARGRRGPSRRARVRDARRPRRGRRRRARARRGARRPARATKPAARPRSSASRASSSSATATPAWSTRPPTTPRDRSGPADVDEAAAQLAAILRRGGRRGRSPSTTSAAATAIPTTSRCTRRACAPPSSPARHVCYAATVSREHFLSLARDAGRRRCPTTSSDARPRRGRPRRRRVARSPRPSTSSSVLDRKRAAMAAHPSQIGDESFFLALPDDTFLRTCRAPSGSSASTDARRAPRPGSSTTRSLARFAASPREGRRAGSGASGPTTTARTAPSRTRRGR